MSGDISPVKTASLYRAVLRRVNQQFVICNTDLCISKIRIIYTLIKRITLDTPYFVRNNTFIKLLRSIRFRITSVKLF